jgi:hypothetical protein
MNELVKINASDYGLEESKANEIKSLFVPMLNKMEELEVHYNDILKQEINTETCQMAKDLRLAYVKVRTGTAEIHKNLKAFYLNGGRFVDAFKNTQAFASGEKEKTLKSIEDHFENIENARLEKLRVDRLVLIKSYTDIEPLALGHMEQAVFDNLLQGFKVAYEVRIAAEKKTEEDRIAKEKADAEDREAQRLENIRLKAEAEEKEHLAEIERKKNGRILAAQKAKADKERTELIAKAETERKEKERLEKEIANKKAVEEKAKKDTELKLQAEARTKVAEEKKAKFAPDKTKLLNFMQLINELPRPEVKSIEAADIASKANTYLVQCANYIRDNANKL